MSPKFEFDTQLSTGKNDGFWLICGIFTKYIRQNIIVVVLRKTNSNWDFFQAVLSLWSFSKKKYYVVHNINPL